MAKMEQITTRTKIAGYEKEVAQLEQLKDFLHNAEKYANCGVHIPKGVLLYGYPGVGKTVMAKSIADENINIVELRAADCTRDNSEEFIQEAFAKAKEMKPCLLLIDEFDKIAGCRDEFYMEMNDKAMKILLQELDSLKEENGVLVVATCNDIRRLGPALVRSGRFDRIFEIGLPSLEDRKKILSLYYDKITMDKSLDVDYVARVTSGYSGAQLECLVNESGILAIERGQASIDFDCFQTAMNRLAFHGIEGEIKDNEKHLVAVHEAGHAIVALYLKPDKLSTATIIPQGQSKGHTRMMDSNLSLTALVAYCSCALNKPVLAQLCVLGSMSIGGTINKVEELASILQVCFDAGAKRILLPMSSAADIATVPSDLFAKFQISFYSSPEDAVVKALGIE